MTKNLTYIKPQEIIPDVEVCELFNYDARTVPVTIRALYDLTGRPFWVNRDEWIQANNRLALNIERLLMPCGEDIIREIRAARGTVDPTVPTTLEAFPVGQYPGIRLADVFGSLNTNGKSAAFILEEIRALIEAQGEGEGGQLEALLQIVALLSV